MSVSLTARLLMIAQLIPACDCIADIGCDHGRLAVSLIQKQVVRRVIATDLSLISLEKARTLAAKCGVSSQLDTRQGNGADPISTGEAQVAVIAGLGAQEISNILAAAHGKFHTLILQPMNCQSSLRMWLSKNGYEIFEERLVREGHRFYEIIAARPGSCSLTAAEAEHGPVLLRKKDPVLVQYLDKKSAMLGNLLRRLGEKNTEKAKRDALQLEQKLREYAEVREWLLSETS